MRTPLLSEAVVLTLLEPSLKWVAVQRSLKPRWPPSARTVEKLTEQFHRGEYDKVVKTYVDWLMHPDPSDT